MEQSAAAAPINRITRVFTHRIIFALRSGRARAELLADVWNLHPDRVKTRTVDMHVSKLRHKLAASDDQSRILVTLHKRGYMLRPFVCAAEHAPEAA